MTTNNENQQNEGKTAKKPDWIVKAPQNGGKTSRFERIGAAWSRDDGGVCIRLVGKQVIDTDVYLYPNEAPEADKEGAR